MRIILTLFVLATFLMAQGNIAPFLEILPYAPPENEQYPIHASVDHFYPTQTSNGQFKRLDGLEVKSVDPPASTCVDGQTCYDGHSGVDVWMPRGTPLLAAAPGTIVWADFGQGVNPCPNGKPPNGDLGVVIIDHHNGYYSTYLHLDPPIPVQVGEVVSVGDTVGYCGDTGCATVTHLHFEMRKGAYYFDQVKSWVVDPFGWWGTIPDPIKEMRNATSVWLWKSSTLIDNGDTGFMWFYGPNWQRLKVGYKGDVLTAPAVKDSAQSRHMALWTPELPKPGKYQIQVFIPAGVNGVTAAKYEIFIKQPGGIATKRWVLVNQDSIFDRFFTIATLDLPQGANCTVVLRDFVPSNATGSNVVFDAIRFEPVPTAIDDGKKALMPQNPELQLLPSRPNPVQRGGQVAGTFFRFRLNHSAPVTIQIVTVQGRMVKKISPGHLPVGLNEILWDGKDEQGRTMSPGIYFFTVTSGREKKAGKIILMK